MLSDKDRDAPGVAAVEATLPGYDECLGWEQELRDAWGYATREAEEWAGEPD